MSVIDASFVDKYIVTGRQDPESWEWYKKAEASFWTAEEVDLATDRKEWPLLSESEKQFVKRVLAFFASSDGLVAENALLRFYRESEDVGVRFFYAFQTMIENIHSEVYSSLLTTLVPEREECDSLFRAVVEEETIRKKAEFMKEWLESDRPLSERIVAYACVEGIFFTSSFAAIFYLKKKGVMPGLTFSNEQISKDEAMHCDFACHLYRKRKDLSQERVEEIVKEAVRIEEAFAEEALQLPVIGLLPSQMKEWIRFVADTILASLGGKAIHGDKNPFDFMNAISIPGKTNFFEKRNADYKIPIHSGEKDIGGEDTDF